MSKPAPRIGFRQFRAVMLWCFRLSGLEARVLTALVALADKHTAECSVSQPELSGYLSASETGIRAALRSLTARGLIEPVKADGQTSRYSLLVESWGDPMESKPTTSEIEGVTPAKNEGVSTRGPRQKLRGTPAKIEGDPGKKRGGTPSSPDLSGSSPAGEDLSLKEIKKLQETEMGVWGGEGPAPSEPAPLTSTANQEPPSPEAQEGPKAAPADPRTPTSSSEAPPAPLNASQEPSPAFRLEPEAPSPEQPKPRRSGGPRKARSDTSAYARAYAAGIEAAQGSPFRPPTEQINGLFWQMVRTHALDAAGAPLRDQALLDWIRATSEQFRRSRRNAFEVSNLCIRDFGKWLDGGRQTHISREDAARQEAPTGEAWRDRQEKGEWALKQAAFTPEQLAEHERKSKEMFG